MENTEIWKIYKETKSIKYGKRIYEVSNKGNVKINGIIFDFNPQDKWSYYKIASKYVHRIVAELFVPNPHNKPFVDHINTNKHDNRADNLRWVTNRENMLNPLTLDKCKRTHKGQKCSESRKTYLSEQNKKRRHMSNGVNHVFVLPEQIDYYLKLDYHFGKK
mgnify:CR=1 FL=1